MLPARNQNFSATQVCANPNGCISNVKRQDLFKFVRWLMWFTAFCSIPLENCLPRRLKDYSAHLNVALEIFLLLAVFHIFVLYIFTFYFNYENGDLEFLVSCSIEMLLYSWALSVKIYFRRIRPDLVCGIMEYVNREHITHSAVGFSYVTMKDCLEKSNAGTKIFVGCCFLGVTFRLFLPIFYEERSLPLPCWYPIDYKTTFIYPMAYFLQIVAQLQLAAAFALSSVYFMVLCFLLSAQFDILNCSLKNIVATAYIYMGASRDELIKLREQQYIADAEVNQYFVVKEVAVDLDCLQHLLNPQIPSSANFREGFQRALKQCAEHHRFILCALQKIESLYSMLWFFKTLEVTFAICLIAFDVVKSSNGKSILQVLSLGQYMVLVLWEMLMICYGGEIIYVNSQRCDEALLRSPWYLHSREVRADILFFLMHAQRAFKLTGGKFYPLQLQKFREIVTTSFSFFTLLQNMDMRN
uniref:Odorant receptor n=1 Tax=Anastrepha ludens TaxID=28586 RepID=A0A9E8DA10_9MUSC|nr:odorant receptor 83a1 [Anastrepha ludens]